MACFSKSDTKNGTPKSCVDDVPPHSNEAYIVMAYLVVTYIVVANVVIAYKVVAYVVVAYIVMAYIVMVYIAMAIGPRSRVCCQSRRSNIHTCSGQIDRRTPRHSYDNDPDAVGRAVTTVARPS